MYADTGDPWDLAGRWYEERKYALTVAALPRRRYRSAFEPGCSVGVLTALLAPRCDRLLAADRVPSAVASARERTRDLPGTEVRGMTLPEEWPEGTFDLIVLSEMLYYFDDFELSCLLGRAVHSLEPGGTLVTAHWDHPVRDHLRTGSQLAPVLRATPGLVELSEYRDPDFVLQTFTRGAPDGSAPPSVAEAEGLV
ncbi:SAM-dependent methyltransferase [Streptomyces tsukubensis]|uniref:SAM-dependent methyltransferase n=1 Tax=Streptomyces tsukubensis TaxID=83656 RepID=A0A1V4AHR7_9ACTN|nr:SAM-dependent methyltransferase [Streptomyces tsukubensis]OON82993.1 SAM-dependent methyltransferase [Streptomyces tsukubensis]QFR97482.1 methyltransferase domain-containing protein [Streptomyces tsukubensis]